MCRPARRTNKCRGKFLFSRYDEAIQDRCSLALSTSPCSISPCFTYTLLNLTDLPSLSRSLISKCLHTCSQPQLVIVLIFSSEHLHHDSLSKGQWWFCLSSAGFPGSRWANPMSIPPVTSNLPSPCPHSEDCCHVPPTCPPAGVTPWTLLQTCKIPPSTKPLMLLPLTPGSFFQLKAG